jgi:putative transcriptional regulator
MGPVDLAGLWPVSTRIDRHDDPIVIQTGSQADLSICQVSLTSQRLTTTLAMMSSERESRLLNRLRVARAEQDLSQERLADAAGVSRQTISSIETGQYCPSTLLAFRLARVLGVRVDGLFWLEGDPR